MLDLPDSATRPFAMRRTRFEEASIEPSHRHEFAQMVMVLAGKWRDDSESGRRVLRFGDVLFHPAKITHAHSADAGTEAILIDLMPSLVGDYCALYGNRPRTIQCSFDALEGIPQRLAEELQKPDFITGHLLELLLRQLLTVGARAVDRTAPTPWITRVLSFIHCHLSERITVADLTAVAAVSESRFAHGFREVTGTSPAAYIRAQRISAATRLLRETDLAIGEIANAAGFYDPAHFCRVYKRETGMTPLEFRRTTGDGGSFGRSRPMLASRSA